LKRTRKKRIHKRKKKKKEKEKKEKEKADSKQTQREGGMVKSREVRRNKCIVKCTVCRVRGPGTGRQNTTGFV
jgi:hypothetical protein